MTQKSPSKPAVVVYSRQGCHLCDEAIGLLHRRGLSPLVVDIDAPSLSQPKLLEMYDQCVPVVTIDGKLRFRGRVNEVLLDRLLAKHV